MSREKVDYVELTLGDRLKHARKIHGLNQSQLAEILGIKLDYVSKIESGKRQPREYLLRRIEKFIRGDVVLSIRDDEEFCIHDPQPHYHPDPQIRAVIQLMEGMDDHTKEDVRLSVGKEKLLRDLLKQKEEREAG